MRAKNPFTTITSSGMLLPIDLLVRIADGDARLPGLTPDAYHLRSGERLNEAASRAWTQCKAAWDSFRRKLAVLPASDTATTLTRNEWLLPLFQELGYGRLQPKPAIVIDDKTYPVSHRWEEHVPIHLLSARYALDKRTAGVDGAAARSPYSMVQELLNRSGKFRWGMVSNGLKLYLLRDNNSLSRAANVELDLEAMMDGEVYADFMLLWLLCHQSRVEILSTGVSGQGSGVSENAETQGAGKKAKGKAKTGGKAAKSSTRKTGKLLIDDDDEENADLDLESDDADSIDEVDALAIPPDPRSLTTDPSSCWLERWTKEAESRGTRAREKLRSGVENAINALGAGFLETRGNEELKHRLATGALDKQDYYRQLLRMVYRLLLLLVAEEKKDENGQNLLHTPGTPDSVRQRYAKFYSVGRLRDLAGLRRGTSHTDLFESLKVLFEKLREGYEPLGIPGLGSFLFSTTATPDLDNAHLSNVAVLDCFRQLAYTDDDSKSRRLVDFGNLGSEELGSVYESLLELHPRINSDKGPFLLDSAAGSERKTSGSYYTPTSLINCLLDSALDPVVDEAIKAAERMASGEWGMVEDKFKAEFVRYSEVNERDAQFAPLWSSTPLVIRHSLFAEHALLALKICDPACGSGHFLIAAAERLALHLARIRTGDDQPSTMAVQHAKRDVIGRCIYGVDLNPMAVELCKVSLWMEALDPGRPLSFLDHHIQCGNSLLGTTPALLKQGIPDEAFDPIEGDVKAVCADLKKRNKRERADRESGQGYLFESYIKLGNLPSEFTRLSSSSDDSVAAVDAKAKRYAELVSGVDYLNARLLADTWCAAFVWKKDASNLGKLCPTERDLRNIEDNPHSILPHMKSEVRRLADQYLCFHWHLAFPDVFRLPEAGAKAEKEQAGWNGGFDAVLGNPPWDEVRPEEKKFFSTAAPEIAIIENRARRRQAIARLEESDPKVWSRWIDHRREILGFAHSIHASYRFPFSTSGNLSTAVMFFELFRETRSQHGTCGVIVPSGIVTNAGTSDLFTNVMEANELRTCFDFENREKFFPNVDSRARFSLVTLGKSGRLTSNAKFGFFLQRINDLTDSNRVFEISALDLGCVNPNTGNCPTFRTRHSAELVKSIHRTHGIIIPERADGEWQASTSRMFDMSYESEQFSRDPARDHVPLFEGKMVHQFNHRTASIVLNQSNQSRQAQPSDTSEMQLRDPSFSPRPQYWVPRRLLEGKISDKTSLEWLIHFCGVTSPTNERTCVVCITPRAAAGNSLLQVYTEHSALHAACLVANLNAFPLDFALREKMGGINLNHFIFRQLPVVSPIIYGQLCPWRPSIESGIWLVTRVLELSYTAWDLEPFASDCGYDGPPFRWDEHRRFLLRCELDAAYFHLYLGSAEEWGNDSPQLYEMFPTPRHAVEYIMETFPIVKRKDIKRTTVLDDTGQITQPGTYITKDTILSIYDAMTDSIRTGTPYQTRLDPPPGPPTDSEGNFIPMEDWRGQPIHIHPPKGR